MSRPIEPTSGNDRVTVPRVTTLAVRPTPTPEPWYMPAFRKLLQDTNVPSPTIPPTPPLSLTGSLPSTYNDRIDETHDKTQI